MSLAIRRRKPRTTLGKLIRAWPWLRLGLRLMRFAARMRLVLIGGLIAAVVGAVARRLRHRGGRTGGVGYSPAPASPPGWGGGTRETGYEGGPGTQTERDLEAVQGDSDEPT